jgi:hypothetical protein
VLLAVPALGSEPTPEEQVHRIKTGKEIEVTLTTGELLRGRMGTVSSTGFVIAPMKSHQGTSRTVAFSEVQLVRSRTHLVRSVVVTGIGVYLLIAIPLIIVWISTSLHFSPTV